ncbi:MAG: LamG domain-containing protein [Candidatus Micrarchaeaceae archaeon]
MKTLKRRLAKRYSRLNSAIGYMKPLQKASSKVQSAMEYLMTYGWAILIIAVVLGALFSLGVFNSMNFAPKAPPGACQVFRPNGPGTTSFINTEGVCNGELPQYVAQFNGETSYISTTFTPKIFSSVSVSLWFYPKLVTSGEQLTFTDTWAQQIGWWAGHPAATTNGSNWIGTPYAQPTSRWYFITITGINSTGDVLYLNGQQQNSSSGSYAVGHGGSVYIGGTGTGGPGCCGYNFNGSIANIQMYNTSLSQAEITALYQEGIGGAPIDLQNLVAWYPLNGNANDYSGNGNNGVPSNVMFVSNWYSGYTQP